jgi:Hint domain
MKRLGNISTRRQLFRVMATGAAAVPLLAMSRKSADAFGGNHDWNDRGRHPWGDHDRGDHSSGNRSGQGGVSCLLRGTSVSTPVGERAVEDLQIGDQLLTLSGPMAIKWVGYSKYTKDDGRPWQASVMPIRVARAAIGDCAPHRDLYLSPEHCVFFNEALIPVRYLINGTTITPATQTGMTAIEYYHIEFETHEVVYAEGALVESFREETWEREYFANFVQYERLYGRERQHCMTPFAPVHCYRNRRQKVAGLARSIVSNVVDVRDPIQVARDQLARRAETLLVVGK